MNRTFGILLATGAIGITLALGGCAERKTTVRRETEIRTQPRIVEEHTTVAPPSDETTVIERRRRVIEEDR